MAKKAAKKSKAEISAAQKVGIGVGLTAAAVTAAGAYFLYGSKSAPKNRKMVKGWALKAKGEVLEALEHAEDITEKDYNALIDTVAAAYGAMKDVTRNDLAEFKREMKGHWGKIEKSGVRKTVAKVAKKPRKKTAKKKKATKKAAKKSTKKKSAKRRK